MQEVNLHKLLPTLVLTNRFKGSGFTFSTQLFAWVPLQTLFDFFAVFLLFYYNTGQRDCQGKIVQISQVLSSKQNRAVEGASPYIYI